MKTKFLAVLMLTSLLAGIFVIALPITPVAANPDSTLYVNPPEVDKLPANVNSFFDVFVTITDVTDLFGLDINVTWTDNTLITIVSGTSNTSTAALLDQVWGAGHWFCVKYEASGGGGGGGYFRYVALSINPLGGFTGSHDLIDLHFQIMRSCNFVLTTPIHIDGSKLSNSLWQNIPATTTDGLFHMDKTVPDLELVLFDPNLSKHFEYCKYFEVAVYATDICAQMTDYDLTFLFDAELLRFVDVDYWGVFGMGAVSSTTGTIHVWQPSPGTPQTGEHLLLFNLTFHVEFDDTIEHIWRVGFATLTAHVSVKGDVGDFSFVEGTIPITGITLPQPLALTINLIRGDVASQNPPQLDGIVDITDLRTVAAFYDFTGQSKYDLTVDGTIDIFDLVVIATNYGYNDP